MARARSTIFRPILGCGYIVMNTETKEKTVCRVLRIDETSKYGQIRSGRICKRGEEFFKVMINEKCHRMNNSIDNEVCLSEDKVWMFTGERPESKSRESKKKIKKEIDSQPKQPKPKKPKTDVDISSSVEFISQTALSKII